MTPPVPQRLATLFNGTVPKDSAYPKANEDKLRTCDARQVYVLSDGASESYNSALWADIIVEAWFTSSSRRGFLRWLREAIRQYESCSDMANMSWSQEAAFARGSFASLLALNWTPEADFRVTAVGDTTAILVKDERIRWSFPYKTAAQFQDRPHLLCTILDRNLKPFFIEAVRAIYAERPEGPCHASVPLPLGKSGRLLCVTDALGAWLLAEGNERFGRLQRVLSLDSNEALVALVEEERMAGTMRRDDTTLLILGEANDATSNP